jgi:prepilin-type N-terminal cleavage/methylation domain-containing protein
LIRRKNGFTLIELLVVIAIIAILAAILFPVFAQAKAAAKKTQSLSNVKQLALAHLMYANDYDDCFATSWLKEFPGDFNYFVQPYMKSLQILINPDRSVSPSSLISTCDSGSDNWGTWDFSVGGKDNPTGLSSIWGYGFNNGYSYNNNTGLVRDVDNNFNPNASYTLTIGSATVTTVVRAHPEAGIPTTQVVAPADTLMLGSTNGLPLMAIDIDDLRPGGFPGVTDSPCESVARVHQAPDNGGYCMSFVDGHAKWQKFNPTLSAGIRGGTNNGLDPLALPNVCQYDSSYDGSSDTASMCKEGYPNG